MSLVNRCVCGANIATHHRHVCWPSKTARITPPQDFDPADAGEQWSDPDGDFFGPMNEMEDDFFDG
jgi:hypothetical protein